MNAILEEKFVKEIILQAERALFCMDAINKAYNERNREGIFREIEHFVQHISAICLILFEGKRTKEDVVSRCSYLREKLDINNVCPAIKKLRNDLVHFDSRLDEWFTKSTYKNFIDHNMHELPLVNGNFEKGDFIRNYDSATNVYTFFGKPYSINKAVEELCRIKQFAEIRRTELVRRNH